MARRPEVEPKLIRTNPVHGDVYEHDAYGMVSYSHLSGGVGQLVGSELKHSHSIMLTIHSARKTRNLNRDWFTPEKQLINIEMSAQQWATFVSTPNCSGVPCTLRRRAAQDGLRECDGIAEPNRDELFTKEIDQDAQKVIEGLQAEIEILNKLVESNTPLKKRDLKESISNLEHVIQTVTSSLPFVIESHKEVMEKNVQAAKTEIEAVLTDAIYNRGLEALTGKSDQRLILNLDMREAND